MKPNTNHFHALEALIRSIAALRLTSIKSGLLFRFTISLCCLMCSQQAVADSSDADDEHLRKLCEHGLTESAISYCQARMSTASDKPGHVALWAMRLMESNAQAALRSSKTADQFWSSAERTLADFEEHHVDDLRLPWLRWQAARNELLKSQSALAVWLAAPALTSMREQALTVVRELEAKLDKLDADIEHRLPLAAKQQVGRETQAPASQLLQLRVDSSLLRCEAMLVRGQCYQSGSRDRIAAATNVSSIAEAALARVPPDWPARGGLLAARATARLELGQRVEALDELQRLASQSAQPLLRQRVSTTIVEALIADGDLLAASDWIAKLETSGDGPSIQLARLRLRLAEISTLQEEDKQTAMEKLVDLAKSIGQQYGDYWRGRADAIIVGSLGSLGSSGGSKSLGIELVLTEVRQLLAAGNDSLAIDKLLDATANAKAAGELAQSIELASQAFALLLVKQAWSRAADTLLPLTAELATTSGAAEAHWLAIRGLLQALQAQPSNGDLQRRYEAALTEQIQLWPDANESQIALQWLEKWLLTQSRSALLLEILQARMIASVKGEVVADALHNWLGILAERIPESEAATHQLWLAQQLKTGTLAGAGSTAEVVSIGASALTHWPGREERVQIVARVRAASNLKLTNIDQQILLAVRILDAARQGELTAAYELGKSWNPKISPIPLVRAWATAFVAAVDEHPFNEHAQWLPLTKELPSWQVLLADNPSLQSSATRWRIAAWDGKSDESRAELQSLLDLHTRDGSLRLQLARLIAEAGPTAFPQVIQLTQQVASGAEKSSELFLLARWLEIQVRLASGESDEPRKIAASTLLKYDIPAHVWQERFKSVAK